LQEAQALAVFIHDRIELNRLVLTPGLRFEDIDQKRTRWETRSGRTSDPASRAASNFRDSRENHTRVWLPGIGLLYDLNDRTTLVAGVHKGFTAPSNSPNVDEEEAINYELGFRFGGSRITAEAIYFLSDYNNLLGECTASSGSDCTIGDAFNGDAATVQGVEMMFSADLVSGRSFSLPLSLNYTYIKSRFDSDIADTDFFGAVDKGDPIPYIPEHQLNVSLGVEKDRWSSYVNLSYVDEVCVKASCGAFEKTDAALVLDVTAHYAFSDNLSFYGKVENLTGEEDIMGRQPYGARPNKDRTAIFGLRLNF
ncbi:MAG: TonB-dependent receptor, partial [Gammaproteobacteria bacterium]|nr:TonB-dependent receptor [Gammaproteobacteria bacterium]